MYWTIARYAAVALLCFTAGSVITQWRADKKLAELQRTYAEELNKAYASARDKELTLRNEVAKIRRQQDVQLKSINDKHQSIVDSLRYRPSASSVSDTTRDCKAATGQELSREHSEFLAREATRADQLRSALAACYQQYDSLIPTK
jgi:hypothetical protein